MGLKHYTLSLVFTFIFAFTLLAQTGTVRGFLIDKGSGEPIMFANVYLEGTAKGATTDTKGFFNISEVPVGDYKLICRYLGYDSLAVNINIRDGRISSQNLYMEESSGIDLNTVTVTAEKEASRRDVQISTVKLTQKDLKVIPATGGEPDLAQFLQILPGVIFTGDQGGQLYIRGGSLVQNKILMDGMTIFNPFHSIGFFSVFETETIRNVEVLTGGFGVEYGGRTSAVINIITRDGNKTRYGGMVSASPFMAKALFEGPIKKLREGQGSSSFLVTAKHSYLDQISNTIYPYVNDTLGIPFGFTDLYGKLSFSSKSGSKVNIFGFNYRDRSNFAGVVKNDWEQTGLGTEFTLVPNNTSMIMAGKVAYSNYVTNEQQASGVPRSSSINGFEAALNFSFYGDETEFKYGFEVNGGRTELKFVNFLGVTIEEVENNTELAGYFKYKRTSDKFVIEPGVRIHYYASLNDVSVEPRIGIKYNLADRFRLKFAGGLYSQNLIGTVSDQDVVNLFVGFLSSPEQVYLLNTDERTTHRLQKAVHGIVGAEIDLTDHLELNIEPYIKNNTQLINLNRNKTEIQEPNFRSETGDARGIDFLLKYEKKSVYLWAAYSLGFVDRFDGDQEYPTNFDRRHNMNLVASYAFGSGKLWEASARWNLGTGFPFTLTQGFYEFFDFQDGIGSDYLNNNGSLGIIYSEDRNTGRLPTYHRLDLSLKRTVNFTKFSKLEAIASLTNAYNRENIFFFDRVKYERVNQLPILPSASLKFSF